MKGFCDFAQNLNVVICLMGDGEGKLHNQEKKETKKMKRTFDPGRGLDDRDNLKLLRGDLDRLLAEYASGDFLLTTGAIRFDREGKNATVKLAIFLKENGVTVTREMTAYNRNAERLGVKVPLGVTVSISDIGLGVFVGYNRRASRYPFLFQISDPQGNRTEAGITYKLTIDQARRACGGKEPA